MTLKKKITLPILGALVLVVTGILIAASRAPDDFKYARSTTIKASPAVIFEYVNNLRSWEAWSPWAKLDPNATTTFEGPDAGQGAKMSWDGNHNIGKGSLTITESVANEKVTYRLDFLKPMESTADSSFAFELQDGGDTLVTWSMWGQNTFPGKIMSVFIDCEKMIGEQFDKGLADLKAIAEAD